MIQRQTDFYKSCRKYNGRTERDITNYIWGNNTIIAEDDNSTRTYTLDNNLVKSINDTDDYSDWSNAIFTYNSSNQLIAVQNTYTDGTSVDAYTWNNGRITKLTYTENGSYYSEEDVYEYTYSGKPAKATSLFIVRLIMMTFSMCILN